MTCLAAVKLDQGGGNHTRSADRTCDTDHRYAYFSSTPFSQRHPPCHVLQAKARPNRGRAGEGVVDAGVKVAESARTPFTNDDYMIRSFRSDGAPQRDADWKRPSERHSRE
jgi:hypothetical protein